ncbi:FtsX-like permease family protein [uncultured Pseudokineococcus sp.]|uniref:ABC transporter permease n=1 Tax=uncultured Pseudokineococcus sp. TaxID=1642928 RepID=UPI0026090424|nr:FtsX-like permease family protein [uncultured Pseudokineococcus sp.]
MLRLTLAQLRHHWGRLLASATAVVIAVAFVVVTLVGGSTASATVRAALAAPFVPAAAVVEAPVDLLPEDVDDPYAAAPSLAGAVDAVRAVDGVTAVALDTEAYATAAVGDDGASTSAQVRTVEPAGSPLRWQRLSEGRLPERTGEVAVSDRLDVAPGGTVTVVPEAPPATSEDDVPAEPAPEELAVVGVLDTGGDPMASLMPQLHVTAEQVAAWGSGSAQALRVAAADGTDPDALVPAVQAAAEDALGVPAPALTAEAHTDQLVDDATGGALQLFSVLLAFAVVAVLVAGLVIANTFAVLLAQRTRELALLRCVGALRSQLRRGVLLEALGTGLAASALGTALGVALVALGSAVVGRLDSPVPLADLSVPWWALLTGVVLGTVVTVAAATSPARVATRVAPLAALRPLDPVPLRSRGGVLRLVLGLVLLVPGAALLAYASVAGELLVGVAAGVPTFLGVVLLCQRAIPAAVGLAGRLLARVGGVPGRLAARNSVRVPRRTAATATALLVGVTLVSTFVVGAASVRATTTTELEAQYPADVQVVSPGGPYEDAGLPAELLEQVAGTPGVTGAAAVTGGLVELGEVPDEAVLGLPAAVDGVVRSSTAVAPAEGEVRVGPGYAEVNGLADGDVVTATGTASAVDLVVRVDGRSDYPVVAAAELERLLGAPPVVEVWASIDDPDGAAASETVDALTATASAVAPDSYVAGAVLVRQGLDQVLDVLLLVVTGLLGVAVVIALVGVGNTLALSVVERRQELGLLRALGQPAGDVRRTLLWEAGLVAGVASVLGVGLGVVFGLAGTASALAAQAPIVLDVPWLQVAAVVVVATAAGMAASLLPARRAARTPPVAAMAA